MNSKFTLLLAAFATVLACSHRSATPETTTADRTVVTVNRGEYQPSVSPERANASTSRTPQLNGPAKREAPQSPAETRAKTEAVTPGTQLTDSGNTQVVEPAGTDTSSLSPDDTGKNVRDWEQERPTPIDQGNSDRDLTITQQIRRAVMGDDTLSFAAKNVKIITNKGKVTLRGPVNSASERATIDNFARRIAGERAVDNQLEVKP
jgi:osmotically-inducible protein OsmY